MLRRTLGRGTKVEKKPKAKASVKTVYQKQTKSKKEEENEKELERDVFGGEGELLSALVPPPPKQGSKKARTEKKRRKLREAELKELETPAWQDPDDEEDESESRGGGLGLLDKRQLVDGKYTTALRSSFTKVAGETPKWASLDRVRGDQSEEDEAEDEETKGWLSGAATRLTGSVSLPSRNLQHTLCTDLNKEEPHTGKLRVVKLHRNYQVGLTAGMDGRFALFQVNGKTNPKVQSVYIDMFPIYAADFSASGEEVILASRTKVIYTFDMMAGKVHRIPNPRGLAEKVMSKFVVSPDGKLIAFLGSYGQIHLLTAKAKEHVDTLKMNGNVRSVTFSEDGSRMYSFGDDSEVYEWDMSSRRCVHRFTDEGTVSGTALALSPDSRYIATGNNSGIVNVYERSACLASRHPKPLRSLSNLHTSISALKFAPSGEALVFASDTMEQAIRLAHLPSMTVFENFPNKSESLRIPFSLDFSPHSGYLTVGNHKGRALLYRLKHYKDY